MNDKYLSPIELKIQNMSWKIDAAISNFFLKFFGPSLYNLPKDIPLRFFGNFDSQELILWSLSTYELYEFSPIQKIESYFSNEPYRVLATPFLDMVGPEILGKAGDLKLILYFPLYTKHIGTGKPSSLSPKQVNEFYGTNVPVAAYLPDSIEYRAYRETVRKQAVFLYDWEEGIASLQTQIRDVINKGSIEQLVD